MLYSFISCFLFGNQIPLHNSIDDNVKSFWYNFGRKMVEEMPAEFVIKSEIQL